MSDVPRRKAGDDIKFGDFDILPIYGGGGIEIFCITCRCCWVMYEPIDAWNMMRTLTAHACDDLA